ncbi:MAG TPA: sensor histidine kinase [Firmicutes bacterium]|nr:sensor histidine kinase [Bacillota bacterium]
MWFIRWRWAFYHLLSAIASIVAFGILFILLFPDQIIFSDNFAVTLAVCGVAIVCSALGAILGSFYSGKEIRGELAEIGLGAKNLAYGNLDYRLDFRGNSEFDNIIVAFNEMAARLESQVGALQKLAEENEQLLQETKISAISEERQRLARDLHDAVSQQLFAISMMAASASKIADSQPRKAASLVREISESATRAQSEMRALLLQLRPLTLQNESLAQALRSLAAELESKQTVKCVVDLDNIDLPKNIENQLYRIAQEGLSNVLRHAQASQVQISLKVSQSGRRTILIIEDNGKGFTPSEIPQSSLGNRSIKERATLLGGTAQWLSVPGKGTKLEVRIPISTETDFGEE